MPFNSRFQKKILARLEQAYDEGALKISTIFENYYLSSEEKEGIACGLVPKRFRKDIFYLADCKYIESINANTKFLAFGITREGLDYLHKPSFINRLFTQAIDKFFINFLCYILGAASWYILNFFISK